MTYHPSMTKLEQLLLAIKDENLSKEKLDSYFSDLSLLRSDVRINLAKLQKEKAMFMLTEPELSIAQRKVNWQGRPEGQREIELKAYVLSLGDALESVKTRIYSLLS